jgi:hypothetical protein
MPISGSRAQAARVDERHAVKLEEDVIVSLLLLLLLLCESS